MSYDSQLYLKKAKQQHLVEKIRRQDNIDILFQKKSNELLQSIRKFNQHDSINDIQKDNKHKEICALCLNSFYEVNYEVLAHKIIDIQHSWGHCNNENDPRIKYPSVLYSKKHVCLFCSQLFWIDDKSIEYIKDNVASVIEASILKKDETSRTQQRSMTSLIQTSHKTILEAKDILSEAKIIYQSSIQDGYEANKHLEVLPELTDEIYSKTQREVDPWLEIDFGCSRNYHSIEFELHSHLKCSFDGLIMLLAHPTGFNDPFIDSVSSIAIFNKEIKSLIATTMNTTSSIICIIPSNVFARVIRIQLRGIVSLIISKLHVLKGCHDNVDITFHDLFNKNEQSDIFFATHSPQFYENNIETMRKWSLNTSNIVSTLPKNKSHSLSVKELSKVIGERYDKINQWKTKTSYHCQQFRQEELLTLFRTIFLASIHRDQTTYKESHILFISQDEIATNEVLTRGLEAFYPKCTLRSLIHRIKCILRWIKDRRHLRDLGPLTFNQSLQELTKRLDDNVCLLQEQFDLIETSWQQHDVNLNERGCSWSQVIIIISLLNSGNTIHIPSVVFEVGEETFQMLESNVSNTSIMLHEANNTLDINANGTFLTSFSIASIESREPLSLTIPRKRSNEGNITLPSLTTISNNILTTKPKSLLRRSIQRSDVSNNQSNDVILSDISHNHSRMRLQFFNNKLKDEKNVLANSSLSISTSQSLSDLIHQVNQETHEKEIQVEESYQTHLISHTICCICKMKFLKSSLTKTLTKHVNKILVNLQQPYHHHDDHHQYEEPCFELAMYDLILVCKFCSQFIHPDFEDGISLPTSLSKTSTSHEITSTTRKIFQTEEEYLQKFMNPLKVKRNVIDMFFDEKYPSRR